MLQHTENIYRSYMYSVIVTFFFLSENTPIQIQGSSEMMIYSTHALRPFGDEETIDSTVTHTLPNLYPLAPTIDLKREHVYREENIASKQV